MLISFKHKKLKIKCKVKKSKQRDNFTNFNSWGNKVSCYTTLDLPATGGLIRPVCVQPLVTKCRLNRQVCEGGEPFEVHSVQQRYGWTLGHTLWRVYGQKITLACVLVHQSKSAWGKVDLFNLNLKHKTLNWVILLTFLEEISWRQLLNGIPLSLSRPMPGP